MTGLSSREAPLLSTCGCQVGLKGGSVKAWCVIKAGKFSETISGWLVDGEAEKGD